MPNRNPESSDYNMPTGNLGSVDNETGLVFNSSNGTLLDTELNIELDTVTGIIYDFKTKKEYSLSDLQSEQNTQIIVPTRHQNKKTRFKKFVFFLFEPKCKILPYEACFTSWISA